LDHIVVLSLITSIAFFATRVGLKELKAIFGDIFQIVEDIMRWILHIKKLLNEFATKPQETMPATTPD
jgi:hypothetical protein